MSVHDEANEMVKFAEQAKRDMQKIELKLKALNTKSKPTKKDRELMQNLQYELELIQSDLQTMGF